MGEGVSWCEGGGGGGDGGVEEEGGADAEEGVWAFIILSVPISWNVGGIHGRCLTVSPGLRVNTLLADDLQLLRGYAVDQPIFVGDGFGGGEGRG